MKTRLGLLVALLIVVVQWLVVAGFVSHSYTWWLKVERGTVTAGYALTIVFSIASAFAVAYSLWAHDLFLRMNSMWRFLSMLVGLGGLAGLLVFAGMIQIGHVVLVNR